MSTAIIDIKYSFSFSGDFQFPYRVSVKIINSERKLEYFKVKN